MVDKAQNTETLNTAITTLEDIVSNPSTPKNSDTRCHLARAAGFQIVRFAVAKLMISR